MLLAYTDGASRGNSGPAASAYALFKNGKLVEQKAFFLGKTTNNVAEYTAVIRALEAARKHGDELELVSDSELVLRQLTGKYKLKNDKLKPLFARVKELEKQFVSVKYRNVSREHPKIRRVDKLCNHILDSKTQD